MTNKVYFWGMIAAALAFCVACASRVDSTDNIPVFQSRPASGPDELDAAIREASDYLNGRLPRGSKAVFLNIRSDYPDLSEYILSGLSENAVNDGGVTVVDRQQLDTIRAELHFQMSGEVSDESAQSIGQILGAQSIVSGAVSKVGPLYRIQVKAIAVQTAGVQGQWSRNVPDGATIAALTERYVPTTSGGMVSSAAATAPGGRTAGGASQGAGRQSAPAAPVTPPPPQTQLFVGAALQGEMDLLDALDWIAQNAKTGGSYTIALGKDYTITPTELNYGGKTVTLILKSAGGQHTVTFEGANPSYSLFNVKSGVTFTLEDSVTLRGTQNDAAKSLVEVTGGRFVMNGGAITGNNRRNGGGGVRVFSGAFTMNGGIVSGNTAPYGSGGGVCVDSGVFTMNGGTISGNIANGGGVYVSSTFIMTGGTISGNSAGVSAGGGVSVGGVFTMSGGEINGNSAGPGGGVYASTFTMTGGTISGNTARSGNGGGVYASTFTMSGGVINGNTTSGYGGGVYADTFTKSDTGKAVIYGSNAPDQANRAGNDSGGHAVYAGGKKRNTTARAAIAMDSNKNGPAGGWE
jgi:hypothetical protein